MWVGVSAGVSVGVSVGVWAWMREMKEMMGQRKGAPVDVKVFSLRRDEPSVH